MRLSGLIRKELVGVQDGKKYGLLEHAELVVEPVSGDLLGIEVKGAKSWKLKNRDTLFLRLEGDWMSRLSGKRIGFGVTASHCTFPELEGMIQQLLDESAEVYPIVRYSVLQANTRFGTWGAATTFIDLLCLKGCLL